MIKICLTLTIFVSYTLASLSVNVDSILNAYAKEVFKLPDSTLFLGKITLKFRGNDNNYYTVDSGVRISYLGGNRYISVETEENGLFFFTISKEESYLTHLGASYDNLLFPTKGWTHNGSSFLGINFAGGMIGNFRHDIEVPCISDLPDTFYLWKIAYDEKPAKILGDFISKHPEHNFISRVKDLLAGFELYYVAESLIKLNKFDSAKVLCLSNLKLRPESKFIGGIIARVAIGWAKSVLEQGNKPEAIEILKDFIQLGTTMGDVGRSLNFFLVSSVANKMYMFSIVPVEYLEFDNEVITEVMGEFLSHILSEKEVYIFKYNSYFNYGNYKKWKKFAVRD